MCLWILCSILSSASLSWMEVNFLNQKPCIPSWTGVFLFDIFWVTSWVNQCVFPISGLFDSFEFSFHIVYQFSPFVIFFWLPHFSPKSLGFFCIRLLVCFSVISSQLLIEFSFIVYECPVLSVLFQLMPTSL